MTTQRLLRIAALSTVLIVSATLLVRACGPDIEPDVFIQPAGPANQVAFAKGRLGVLQDSYYIAPKAVAFRYLNGGSLDTAEQAQLAKIEGDPIDWYHLSPEDAAKQQAALRAAAQDIGPNRWAAAAMPFATVGTVGQNRQLTYKQGNFAEQVDVLNCPDNAFDTAAATLSDRAKRWGKDSPALRDWLKAQMQVFSNCVNPGETPPDAPANATPLLVEDRAYQKAAALFYAGQYPASRAAFAVIARDTSSPWSRWGDYLAARSLVRQAFLSAPTTDPDSGLASFDRDLLAQAAQILNEAQKQAATPALHHAIQAELDFVNARLEPEALLQRLAAHVAGPQHDPDFGQHLVDLSFLLDAGKTANAPLLLWLQTTGTQFGAGSSHPVTPAKGLQDQAATRAQHPGQTPWLIATLMQATTPDPALLSAAAAIPESSPAYLTAQFHRARLLLAAGQNPAARDLTSHVLTLTRQNNDPETTNAFLSLRLQTAETLDAFLADAPRSLISGDSMDSYMALCADRPSPSAPCKAPLPNLQFDADAAAVFNQRLPLSLWVEAAHSSTLPEHLRAQVAWAAWVRALVLNQPEIARSLLPLLPEPVRNVLSKSPEPSGYAASLILLHAPGFKPYLNQGVQRSATYATSSELRDNWWCATPSTALNSDGNAPGSLPEEPAFLTPAQRDEVKLQLAILNHDNNGVVWLGQRVIDYVKAHPDQPIAAESLALVVRATHYGGCAQAGVEKEQTQISKEAFTLLHTRYPQSDWTAKTPYYY